MRIYPDNYLSLAIALVTMISLGTTMGHSVSRCSNQETNFTTLLLENSQNLTFKSSPEETGLKRGLSTPFLPERVVKKNLELILARLRSYVSDWAFDFEGISRDMFQLDSEFWNVISQYDRLSAPTDSTKRLALFTLILFETMVESTDVLTEVPPACRGVVIEIYKTQILVLSMLDSYGYPDLSIDWYAERVILLQARLIPLQEWAKLSLRTATPRVVKETLKQLRLMESTLQILDSKVPK